MKKTQKLYRFAAIALVGVFFCTVLITGLQPLVANAAPYSKDNVAQRAKAWVMAAALSQCASSDTDAGDLSTDEALSGSWFRSSPSVGEYAALIAEEYSGNGKHDNDAKTECDYVVPAAFDALGFGTSEDDYKRIMCKMGYARKNGSCEKGTGDFYASDVKSKWEKVVKDEYFEGQTLDQALKSEMRFYIYMWEFQIECGNGEGDGYGRGSADGFEVSAWGDGDDYSSKKVYRMPWFDFGSGKYMKDQYVASQDHDENHNVNLSGWNIMDSDAKASCGSIADRIRDHEKNFVTAYDKATADGGNLSTESGSGTEPKTAADTETCESNGGTLAWLLCEVIGGLLDGAINMLDSWINNLLFVDGDRYKSDQITAAWTILRNIALLILVPMMMFMVIGTALNFGPFDPYTVKKALPRMMIAVIFIVLSLPITQFGVAISNVAGQGIGNIILSGVPAESQSIGDILASHVPSSVGVIGFAGVVAAGAYFTGTLTIGIVLLFAATTALALLTGFLILVMRQVLLIMLIVISPLAILVWIFPGNDKLWSLWKGTFIAMLLMYPIIAVLLASGKFVAGLFG